MTDEKNDDVVENLQEEIEESGIHASAEDTFELLPGKDAVIFIIKDPPGQKGKALALQLPLSLAIQLGNALVNCAVIAAKIEEEFEEDKPPTEKEVKKATFH